MLDYPAEVEQPEATKKRNAALREQFQIDAYPTLLLLDEKGRPYSDAKMISDVDGHSAQLHELSKRRSARDQKFAAAAKLQNIDKAKTLRDGLNGMNIKPSFIPEFYSAEIAEIAAADPEDTLGVSKMAKMRAAYTAMSRDLDVLFESEDWDAAIMRVDQYIETSNPTGELLQKALTDKLFFLEEQKDFSSAILVADEIIKADPGSTLGKEAAMAKKEFQKSEKTTEAQE